MAQSELGYDLKKGDVIQNTYEILEPLGRGGMGATYKARHTAMGHLVAVKVINAELCNDKRALDLFKREANLMRDLGKSAAADAIVKIETLLQDGAGTHYLIMEFVDGHPLSYYTSKGARLSDGDLLAFAQRMRTALAAIHQKGIVHRDIAPDNIMIPGENILDAKILDFGVATDTVDTEKSILGDTFAGKIGYASPEQLGLFGEKVTGKSDLYSLGLVLLTTAGIKPPGKGSMATAIEERKVDIDLSATNLSPQARSLIEGLLKANPDHRTGADGPVPTSSFTQMIDRTEMKNDLQNAQSEVFENPPVDMPAQGTQVAQNGGSKRGLVVVAGAAAVAAISIGGYVLSRADQSDAAIPAAETLAAAQTADAPQPQAQSQPQTQAAPKQPDTSAQPSTQQPSPVAESQAPTMGTPPTQPSSPGGLLASVPELIGRIISPDAPLAPSQANPETAPEQQAPSNPTPQIAKPKTDPFPNILTLIELGGRENLQQAERSLVRLANNAQSHTTHRAKAAFMLGRMIDPKFHNSKVSTRAVADPTAALGHYKHARDLGMSGLQADITRLGG